MTSVFCTSTSTPTDGSTRDSSSTTSTEWKNVPPLPPYDSGISMPMTPSPNRWSMSARGNLACSSISRTSGRTAPVDEFAHAGAQQLFVFGELGERRHGLRVRGCHAAECYHWPIRACRCHGPVRVKMLMIRRLAPTAVAALMSAASAGRAEHAERAAAAAAAGPAAADVPRPRRHRQRGRERHGQAGPAGHGPEAGGFRDPGGRQAADHRQLQAVHRGGSRATSASIADANITSLQDQQREGAESGKPAHHDFSRRLPRRLGNALQMREHLALFVRQLEPARSRGGAVPAHADRRGRRSSRNHDGTAEAMLHFEGRKYDYKPKNDYEQQYANAPPEVMEQMRNELTIRALTSACVFMGSMREGRKTDPVRERRHDGHAAGRRPHRPARRSCSGRRRAGSGSTQAFFATPICMSRMRDIFGAATRNNTSIFTLDPRGLATRSSASADNVSMEADRQVLQEAIDSLRTIADQTDGRAIVNRNDPLPELQKMVQGAQRVLPARLHVHGGGARRTIPSDPGAGQAPDVEVKARKGYWALTEDEARAMPPRRSRVRRPRSPMRSRNSPASSSRRRASPPATCWRSARGTGERARVTLVWEVRAACAGLRSIRSRRIVATITTRRWAMRSSRARCRRIPRPARQGR